MQYVTSLEGRVLTLRLSGRLTYNDHALARAMMQDMVTSDAHEVVVDVTELTFIDSPGVGMLLIVQEELRRVDKAVRLVGAQGTVKRVFRAIRMDTIFAADGAGRDLPAGAAAAT